MDDQSSISSYQLMHRSWRPSHTASSDTAKAPWHEDIVDVVRVGQYNHMSKIIISCFSLLY
jgi:hypothetical protein